MSKAAIDINNLPYADGDFFAFEQLLSGKERDRLAEVREFLAREVKPIAVDCWNRGEFPMDLIPKLAEVDLVSPVRRQGYSNLFAGILHAEVTRADASIATFMGVHDGLFTGSIEALASQEQKEAWLPDIYSLEEDRRLRPHRAAGRFRCCRRHPHHGPPRRRQLDPQRRQALDRQRHILRLGGHLCPATLPTTRSRASLLTPRAGLLRHKDREQDLPSYRPERGHHAGQRGGAGLLQACQRQQLPGHQQGPEGDPARCCLAGRGPAARGLRRRPALRRGAPASSAARSPPSSWSRTSSSRSSATPSAPWA